MTTPSCDPLLGQHHYPAAPTANPTCRSCGYYSAKTITCDHFLLTGRHKTGVGTDCNAWIPRRLVKPRHPWYESIKQ